MDLSQTSASAAPSSSSADVNRPDKIHSIPINDHMNHQVSRRMPNKGERRVRFADTMGMELVSIFLFDLINNYYFASIHSRLEQQQQHHQQQHEQKLKLQRQLQQEQLQQQLKQQQYNNSINNNQQQCQQKQQSQLPYNQQQQLQPQQFQQQQSQQQQQLPQQQQQQQQQQRHQPTYICDFAQPISLISFKERVKLNNVHLETCIVNSRAGNISITCTIRVLNKSYDKSVIVRYSTDEWHTFTDCLASYKPGSNDGWSDRFTSTYSVANRVKESPCNNQRIIFAIKYAYDGDKVSWDNNGGLNYVVKRF